MKTIAFFALSILSITLIENAQACSMEINQLYQKNLLVAYAASEMNVNLAKASSIAVSAYAQTLSGEASAGSCPTHLNNQAQVVIKYKPNVFQQCTASVLVKKMEQIGGEMVDGPMIEIQTESVSKSCSSIIVRPGPLPH